MSFRNMSRPICAAILTAVLLPGTAAAGNLPGDVMSLPADQVRTDTLEADNFPAVTAELRAGRVRTIELGQPIEDRFAASDLRRDGPGTRRQPGR